MTQTLQQILNKAQKCLGDADIDSARLDARLLLQHVLEKSHEQLLLHIDDIIDKDAAMQYDKLISRRLQSEPVAKIIGRKPFWNSEFITNEHTLDPRPDSEALIELVLEHCTERSQPYRIIDFGTGTGCLLISLLQEYPNATGVAVDISQEAIEVAERNIALHNLRERASTLHSHWGEQVSGEFDIIISNPPYIPESDQESLSKDVSGYDPHGALFAGDGYDAYRALAACTAELLAPKGALFYEIGQGQEDRVESIMAQHDWILSDQKADLAGIIRALCFNR